MTGVIGRGANRIDAARTTRTYRLTAILPANQSLALTDAGDVRMLLHSAGAVRTLWRSWAQCDSSTTLPSGYTSALPCPFFLPGRPRAASPLPAECPDAPTRCKKHTFRSRVAITKIKPRQSALLRAPQMLIGERARFRCRISTIVQLDHASRSR